MVRMNEMNNKVQKEEIKGIVGGVYMISEMGTNRVYVGSANDKPCNGIQKRWTNHVWKIEQGKHKYFNDVTKVRFEILEVAKGATDEELSELETRYFEYVQRVGFTLVNDDKRKVKRKSPVADTSRMKAAQSGANNPRAIKVECEGITYGCVKECAESYGVNVWTMRGWLNGNSKMPEEYMEKGLKEVK